MKCDCGCTKFGIQQVHKLQSDSIGHLYGNVQILTCWECGKAWRFIEPMPATESPDGVGRPALFEPVISPWRDKLAPVTPRGC